MIIAGIDASVVSTGLALFNTDSKTIVYDSLIKGNHDNYYDNSRYIAGEIKSIFQTYNVEVMVIEQVYSGLNAMTTIKLAMLRGMICDRLSSYNDAIYIKTIRMNSVHSILKIPKDDIIRYPAMWNGPKIKKHNNAPSIKPQKIGTFNYVFDHKLIDHPVNDDICDAIILAYAFYNADDQLYKFNDIRDG